ncbi:MAG: hypothetical protein AAF492_30850, partial [Verrucomicrobiota bacterium]
TEEMARLNGDDAQGRPPRKRRIRWLGNGKIRKTDYYTSPYRIQIVVSPPTDLPIEVTSGIGPDYVGSNIKLEDFLSNRWEDFMEICACWWLRDLAKQEKERRMKTRILIIVASLTVCLGASSCGPKADDRPKSPPSLPAELRGLDKRDVLKIKMELDNVIKRYAPSTSNHRQTDWLEDQFPVLSRIGFERIEYLGRLDVEPYTVVAYFDPYDGRSSPPDGALWWSREPTDSDFLPEFYHGRTLIWVTPTGHRLDVDNRP